MHNLYKIVINTVHKRKKKWLTTLKKYAKNKMKIIMKLYQLQKVLVKLTGMKKPEGTQKQGEKKKQGDKKKNVGKKKTEGRKKKQAR